MAVRTVGVVPFVVGLEPGGVVVVEPVAEPAAVVVVVHVVVVVVAVVVFVVDVVVVDSSFPSGEVLLSALGEVSVVCCSMVG